MPAPVRPEHFKKLIVEGDDTLAQAIIKVYVRLPILIFRLMLYMFRDKGDTLEGNLTDEFGSDICQKLNCPD